MNLVAGLWGFAEATLFFIVPDVWLSVMAVRCGPRAALVGSLCATAGALAGGAVMYAWGAWDPLRAAAVLEAVPAIGPDMLAEVRAGLERHGVAVMIAGAFSGVPYKLYAALAPAAGIGPWLLLAATVPARLSRFVLASLLAAYLSRGLARWLTIRARLAALAGFWAVFYTFYFSAMPSW